MTKRCNLVKCLLQQSFLMIRNNIYNKITEKLWLLKCGVKCKLFLLKQWGHAKKQDEFERQKKQNGLTTDSRKTSAFQQNLS